MSTTTCPSNSKACHCGNMTPRSRVSQRTAPAGPLTCFHVHNSKICFLHAFCCFLLHLPSHTSSAEKSVAMADKSPSTSDHSPPGEEVTKRTRFYLPLQAICYLNFNLSVGEMPTACPPRTLARTTLLLDSFLTPILMQFFSKTRFPLAVENLTSHFFLLACSFAPDCFLLVLKFTPEVSTLVASPFFLLHS